MRDALASAVIAAILLILLRTPIVESADGVVYDAITRLDRAMPPRVLVIENSSGERVPDLVLAAQNAGIKALGVGSIGLSSDVCEAPDRHMLIVRRSSVSDIVGTGDPAAQGSCRFAPQRGAMADYGIFRQTTDRIEAGLSDYPSYEALLAGRNVERDRYYVRMPDGQNIPRISAKQLVGGDFARGQLSGMTALAQPANDARLATSLDPQGRLIPQTVFEAYAVQTLMDGREIFRASWILSAVLLFAIAFIARRCFAGFRARRFFLLSLCIGVALSFAFVLSLFYIAQIFASPVLLGIAVLLGGITKLRSMDAERDRRIERTIDQAIDISFDRKVFLGSAGIVRNLEQTGAVLGLPFARMRTRNSANAEWEDLFSHGVANETPHRIDFDGDDRSLRYEYALPVAQREGAVGRVLGDAFRRFRTSSVWQNNLLSDANAIEIDRRVRGAANLIASHGDELARGLDALDTGVFVFRPLGMPVYANAEMCDLLAVAEIDIDTTSLVDTIVGLSDLDEARAQSMVRGVLLQGGDMRVPMRDIGARQRILRLGIATKVRHRAQTVLVLEAVDITELDRLAELRLAVGTFIDRQLRNDLEAILLGTSLARDPRMKAPALMRVLDRILDVAKRASDRLDDVRGLLEEQPYDGIEACYPVEARKVVAQALERAMPYAKELDVEIDSRLPAISGFSIAEPLMLSDMVEAMLRLILADTATGEKVFLALDESETGTTIEISGGFGLPFDRFIDALDAKPGEVPAEYQIAAAGIAQAVTWRGNVSYWSAPGKGFRFIIQLRRV